MKNNNMEENVVPLFRTIEDLLRDEKQIMEEYARAWEAAYVTHDIATAAIKGDTAALAKFADADAVALAKAKAADSIAKYGSTTLAEIRATAALHNALLAATEKRDRRLFGMSNISKRAHRFAMATDRRAYGPGATMVPPEELKEIKT